MGSDIGYIICEFIYYLVATIILAQNIGKKQWITDKRLIWRQQTLISEPHLIYFYGPWFLNFHTY